MSGRLPRLRALRPRPQPHLQNTPAPTRTESRYNKEEEEEINDEEDELLVENEEDIEGGVDEEEEEEDEIIDEQELEEQESVNDDRFKSDESEKRLVIKEEPVEIVTEEPEDSERNYECKTCNPPKGLSNLKAYLAHLKNEHKQKVKCYECPHCEFVCQHVKKLQRHFRVAHEDLQDKVAAESAERSRCPMCAHIAANPQDLETHQRVHHLKRRFFRCAKCSYVTHVRARYTKHVKYHSMPMIKCDACDFRTPYKWNLDRHTRNHGGGGAFQCRACNFTADIRQSLTVHETNHHEPPVGRTPRKMNTPFERKPRNSPKRYNQVGASDFRDTATGSNHPEKLKSGSPAKSLSPDKNLSSPEDRRSAIAGAECIALKCEEKGCQFITAWDSKMQRHLAESHSQNAANKPKKPLPMLIPLSPVSNAKANNAGASGPGTTLLKVPRVRVRPELARIARDTEMARLYGNKEVRSLDHQKIQASELKKEAGTTDSFEKKNASFFDKLKERLMTTSGNNGIAEVAIEQQSGDERIYGERTGEDRTSDEPPTKILIMSDTKEYPQPPELTPAPVSLLTSTNSSREISALPLRPPPPLKAATRSQGQSLLKNNPAVSNANATVTPTTGVNASLSTTAAVTALAITPVTAMAPSRSSPPGSGSEESKRTLWKCKRCNFRDSNKETVLIHVKSHYESMDDVAESEKNAFTCEDCPFSAADAESLALHRVHHRPNLEAIFKCYLCPYYVSTKVELLDHARLHGEELAVVHQRNVESESPPSKRKYSQNHRTVLANNQTKEESSMEQVIHITSPSTSTSGSVSSKGNEAPPLLLDTRALPDAPLVWVSRTDGTIAKMLKCRHCPHVSSRRAEVRDHESMHMNSPNQGSLIACPSCSFACSRREVMDSHAEMHSGALGTVHCLVDEGRTDAQQLNDLSTLLGLPQPISVASEPDLRDSRLVHCCSKCPARFLCEKELRIHLRYHCTELAYSCQWCSYAARQPAHLLAHQKAHSPEYQDRTRYLLSLYGHSQRYPPPTTACVEANTQDSAEGNTTNVAWIVVEVGAGRSNVLTNHLTTSSQETGNQVFTCAKCPARYFKLDALEYHMTLHGTNNRFKCTECDYSSKTAQNLVKHQVVHRRHAEANENVTSSRLLPPPDPQFGILMRGNPNFVYPGYLRNGRLREKRYKCHKCPSAFEKREQYRIHLTLHGAKQRYRCDTCDYSVKYYANYAQHLRKHQANAQAQASRRRYEDDAITIDTGIQSDSTISISRSGKSLTKSSAGFSAAGNILASGSASNSAVLQVSNQDKQSLMLLQKKGVLVAPSEVEAENIRCQDCPFSTPDKDVMDAHKRRHGIERMTPPCPHCDYVPRKDENVGDHIRLHFTRLYKPDSYLIAELLTLTMRRVPANGKEDAKENELLFKECGDGRFLPIVDPTTSSRSLSPNENSVQEKVIVDPNTGEAKHHLTV
ncbi:uncharacterized protein LOC107272394 isoform X7 [Cephus cinctus]|uniref:Uncharacterized protein LOC107272394 isoform X7 n=1 Tax=Cephus cinctus TaxID=211228 RepID=A0AAJ7FRQ5_CEPCN|nr:uncharacterized protein LOC107272394 isoform X7 [Cephus cinctus]